MMTPFPGTVDFGHWEKEQAANPTMVGDVPITRYWLIPTAVRPKMFTPHPTMSSDEIRERTQKVWDRFYNWGAIWKRSACCPNSFQDCLHVSVQALPADVCGHGHLDRQRAAQKVQGLGQWTARQCKKLFQAKPCRNCPRQNGRVGWAASGRQRSRARMGRRCSGRLWYGGLVGFAANLEDARRVSLCFPHHFLDDRRRGGWDAGFLGLDEGWRAGRQVPRLQILLIAPVFEH